jgi:hypothetical protein
VIAVVLRPVLLRPQCKPLLESGWAPSNPSDSKESRSLRTDTKIGDEIPALGPDDTVTFVDKNNINRRITYRPGDSTTKRAPPIK